MKKRSVIISLLSLLLCSCARGAPEMAEISFLKVGKADAILITTAEHAILIDAAEQDDGDEILKALRRKGVRRLDMMIITHFDKDHVGGADQVLREFPVEALYDANYETGSKPYRDYLSAIAWARVPRVRVQEKLLFTFDGLALTLLPSPFAEGKDNDRSLLASMTYGEHSFFFAADAEEALIASLLSEGIEPHTVLKLPHHGRMKTNLADFLDAIRPTVAVITDSDKNPVDDRTLSLLSDANVSAYETRFGDITITSDGKQLSVRQ